MGKSIKSRRGNKPAAIGLAMLFGLLSTGMADEPGDHPFDARPQAWQRRDDPVLSADTTKQTWCQVVLYSPHVIVHEGTFRMWYLGTSTASRSNDIALGYAESPDGFEWTEHPDNPILTGDDVSWGRVWQTPFVLYDNDERIFKMWFVSGDGIRRDEQGNIRGNDQRLGYATSRDGIEWAIHLQPIFPTGRSPSVIKEGPDRYRMWMNSRPNADEITGGLYKNIYEFSSTDGLHWERAEKPAIRPSGSARTTVYPFVLKENGRFHMCYGGHTPGKFEIFYASSEDGAQWTINHETPAFPARSDKGFFDSRYTSTPCIVSLPDRYLLYYSARDMRTTYIDSRGRKRKDGAGIYAHIGVAVLEKE